MAIIAAALVLATLVGGNQDTAGAIDRADADTVYVADGTNFADALMGATIAGLNTSPMLGVAPNTIPAQTSDELDRLTDDKSDLLETIYVFGGTAAVSSGVFDQLGQWATNVERIKGDSRWGTYQAISQMLPSAIDEAVHAQQADDADRLDGSDGSHYLDRSNHTGTQAPSSIAPQGAGSGLDADTVDGQQPSAFAAADHGHLDLFDSVTSTEFTGTSSTSWEDVPGMSTQVTIPAGHAGVIVARFSAETACIDDVDQSCYIRFLQDGAAMSPYDSSDLTIFDHTGEGDEPETQSTQRISSELGPGTYTVKVQRQVSHTDTVFRLDGRSLVTEVKLTS